MVMYHYPVFPKHIDHRIVIVIDIPSQLLNKWSVSSSTLLTYTMYIMYNDAILPQDNMQTTGYIDLYYIPDYVY